ncbi:tRNA (cytosine(32)/uridine(32)-2'-O)-methyltransferase TrmJ [Oceanicoccus sp. KOV_DT_Chl]|uniref:tRNA (cytosine(32)/uridine(32)-2'-O)-methyltransferase TrmJ n=1 Tax=Oceanicoccus sp. KOV_DT_Chl TaxID=1904639 RepID=UPI001F2D6F21|nr:tRNA (cytosine(32)/uridine(32)-2'-O)-methyltransferase TrmJ [Oceanicoccus sp. KOV_DT_Chl]
MSIENSEPNAPSNPLSNARIVLVHTTHPGNIGAVARAMKNMGLQQLYLVKPKAFPHERAIWRSASAVDILDNAVVVETLEEAVADCGLVVGTSARGRRIPWPLVNPRVCAEKVYPELAQHPVALVFGREDRGLTNEELQACHLHVNIPASEDYSSLNLGMAVQVVSYELRMHHLAMQDQLSTDEMQEWDTRMARVDEIERMFVHLEETLIEMDFLNPAAPKQLMTRLRRLYNRTRMDDLEVQMMRGILTSTQQWVRKARDK